MVHTGVRAKIIPDLAKLDGTIRVFDDEVKKTIERRVREIVESIARGSGRLGRC
jgi:metal-dependent amidase/aminoacylase/carboxypeptidase family protein